jgi:hypothetical protein
LNPPFSAKNDWLNKAVEQYDNCSTIYIVTPDSTDVKSWWHEKLANMCEHVWFSKGRINYVNPNTGEKEKGVSFGTSINIMGELNDEVKKWFSDNGDLMKRCNF